MNCGSPHLPYSRSFPCDFSARQMLLDYRSVSVVSSAKLPSDELACDGLYGGVGVVVEARAAG
jgi:hypothetical protein